MVDPVEVVNEVWQDPNGRVAYVQAFQDRDGAPMVTFGNNNWVDYPPGDGWVKLSPVTP